jgi:hypothetical protein
MSAATRLRSLRRGARELWDFVRHPSLGPDIDLSDLQLVVDPPPPGPAQVPVEGTFARFHSRAFGDPARLHTLLLDVSAKLDAAERFAQKGLHCGHFFAAGAEGARSEARNYGIDLRGRFLLEVELEIPDILDLTNQDTLRDAVALATDPAQELTMRPYTQSLAIVLDQANGGNPITDKLGATAFHRGDRGILFFGARALTNRELSGVVNGGGMSYHLDREAGLFADLRAQKDLLNLVIFSAADAVLHTRRFRVDGGPWWDNPLFGAPQAELDAVYQREGLPASVVGDPKEWLMADVESQPFPLDHGRADG